MTRTICHPKATVPGRRGYARRRTSALFALGVALASSGRAVTAQEAGVELEFPTRVLEVGESIDAQLECVNTGPPSPPEAGISDGLDVKLLGSQPSTSSFMQIVNGRMTQRTTYTYHLRITALEEGRHTLGPISVTAEGRRYRTEPVQIVVRRTDAEATPKGDRFVFADIEVEPQTLYLTETYTARLTAGVRRVEIGGRTFNLDWLRNMARSGSQLSVFTDARWRRGTTTLRDSSGRQHTYDLLTATRQVRAEQSGAIRVGPVFIKIDYPTAVRPGWFGDFEVTRRRRETARADAASVMVKAPPPEGRPDSYNGAIGQYSMTVSAKPTRVTQGRPITLSIAVTGAPLEGVAAPDLSGHGALADRFDYSRDELAGDIEGSAKVFRRAIFPRQPGRQTIPSVVWSYFDPEGERYVRLTSDPIDIQVDPASPGVGGTTAMEDDGSAEQRGTPLRVVRGGLSPNYVDAGGVLADQSFVFSSGWKALVVFPPMSWLAAILAARRQARLKRDVSYARRRRARNVAQSRIRQALRNGEPAEQYAALAAALTGYVADRYGLPSANLTPAEVRALLSANGVGEATAEDVAGFLETCDALRYARGFAGGVPGGEAAARVRKWIRRIERSGS